VVVTRVGGLPEVVGEGTTGLLVPADDPPAAAEAIGALLRDRERADMLGRAGRALVQERFEWADCVEAMLAVLHDAASRPARGVPAPPRPVTING
jgi:starch synthase